MTAFVAATGANGGTATRVPTMPKSCTTTVPTSDANLEATTETNQGSTIEATTGEGNRRGDRRIIINPKHRLRKFMSDQLNEYL